MDRICNTKGEHKMRIKYSTENLKGSDHSGDLGVHESIILKLTLKKEDLMVWSGFNWLRI
jgi:hypothetical protein